MDGGTNEKTVASSLKAIVKHTSKRSSAGRMKSPSDSSVAIAPKLPAEPPASSALYRVGQKPAVASRANKISDVHFSVDDSALLMHYLDVVFQLQNPHYRAHTAQGRGWLFSLLVQTRPLYHGALALSAYHLRTAFRSDGENLRAIDGITEEQHLSICLKALAQAAENSCAHSSPAVTMAVLQMFYYQVCHYIETIDTY
jgi:C6 transcription factor Pro1